MLRWWAVEVTALGIKAQFYQYFCETCGIVHSKSTRLELSSTDFTLHWISGVEYQVPYTSKLWLHSQRSFYSLEKTLG